MVEFVVMGESNAGSVLSMECSSHTKFSEVSEFLRLELGDNLFRVYLEHHGSKCVDLIPSYCLQDFFCNTKPIPLMVINPKEEIQVKVRTLTGKVETYSQPLNYSIEHLKSQIMRRNGVPPDQQRFVFGANQLEDSKTLQDYGIKHNDTIHLVLRLRGGGFSFIDVSKDEAQIDLNWSPTAPKWRIVVPGLSVEGVCANNDCAAYQEYIICNYGCTTHNFKNIRLQCPICYMPIDDKENLGFSNCFYKIRGMKSGSNTEFCTAWTKAGNFYRTWDEKKAGTSNWSYLEIITRELSRSKRVSHKVIVEAPIASECAICFCDIKTEKEATMLECTHSYHSLCWKQWGTTLDFQKMTRTCPLCRTPITS